MNTIEKIVPAFALSATVGFICDNLVPEEFNPNITPVIGVIIGASLLLTTKKIIELAVNTFGTEHMKNAPKSVPWLIAPAFTIGILALTGVIQAASVTAVTIACISVTFFYYENPSNLVKPKKSTDVQINTFSSIAGMEDVKKKLREQVILPIKNRELSEKYQLNYPRGILFYGLPGCGKTFFAMALAGELNLPYFSITAGDIASVYIHGTTQNITKIFSEAISNSPCVLFMDELDGIACRRQENDSNISQSINEQITELITQIDRAIAAKVTIIGATNLMKNIDPAILRNGRFDTKIEIPKPDEKSRGMLFKMYLNNRVTKDISFAELIKKSQDYSCADIKNMVENAARKAFNQSIENNPTDRSYLH